MDKLEAFVMSVIDTFGPGRREVLVTISTDKWLDLNAEISKIPFIRSYPTKAINGIGGNVHSVMMLGVTLHIKIDTDLK